MKEQVTYQDNQDDILSNHSKITDKGDFLYFELPV